MTCRLSLRGIAAGILLFACLWFGVLPMATAATPATPLTPSAELSPRVTRGAEKKITNTDKAKAVLNTQMLLEEAKTEIGFYMDQAAEGDAAAEDLVEKFKTGTVAVSVQPDGELVVHLEGTSRGRNAQTLTPLAIVGPGELGYLKNSEPVRGFEYRDGMFVYTATNLWTPWFLGVAALGQVARWDAIESGRVTDPHPLSPSSLDVELQAQQMMVDAIDRRTGGMFSRAIRDRIRSLDREFPTELINIPRLSEDELAALTALAFVGEVTLNQKETAQRSNIVATAYYLAMAESTPDAHRSVLRLMRSWDKEAEPGT